MKTSYKLWLLIILLAGAGELWLPSVSADLMAGPVQKALASRDVQTETAGRPALLMLGGRFGTLKVTAHDAKFGQVAVRDFALSFQDVQLDMPALFLNKKLIVRSAEKASLTAVLTQDELAGYINDNVKGARDARVTITPEGVHIESKLLLGNVLTVDVSMDGQIIADGSAVKFRAKHIDVRNGSLGGFHGALPNEIVLIGADKLPMGLLVRDVQSGEGEIRIYADSAAGRR